MEGLSSMSMPQLLNLLQSFQLGSGVNEPSRDNGIAYCQPQPQWNHRMPTNPLSDAAMPRKQCLIPGNNKPCPTKKPQWQWKIQESDWSRLLCRLSKKVISEERTLNIASYARCNFQFTLEWISDSEVELALKMTPQTPLIGLVITLKIFLCHGGSAGGQAMQSLDLYRGDMELVVEKKMNGSKSCEEEQISLCSVNPKVFENVSAPSFCLLINYTTATTNN